MKQFILLGFLASTFVHHVECRPFIYSSVGWERRRCAFGRGHIRGGAQSSSVPPTGRASSSGIVDDQTCGSLPELPKQDEQNPYGRVSAVEFRLTPAQIEAFHRDGCVTIPNVLTEGEIAELERTFDQFMKGEIAVPGKDFCDMSKPFGIPQEEWSIVNCMLPTTYYPALLGNVYEKLTVSMARQLFPTSRMTKDYDQLLNKRPRKLDAVFAYHQDIAYWPGAKALGVNATDTCTFSLAVDDSTAENGCLRYVAGSGTEKVLRPHRPLCGTSRDEGHALVVDVDEATEDVRLAPASRGSVTIHNEWVVHGSSGNGSNRQRRTYVIAYRSQEIVEAERRIGFTHSHNDKVNWDTFQDGETHRINAQAPPALSRSE
jgi:phytanoyl-CoA hydroxylase